MFSLTLVVGGYLLNIFILNLFYVIFLGKNKDKAINGLCFYISHILTHRTKHLGFKVNYKAQLAPSCSINRLQL